MIRRFGLLLAVASIIGLAACGGSGGGKFDCRLGECQLFAHLGNLRRDQPVLGDGDGHRKLQHRCQLERERWIHFFFRIADRAHSNNQPGRHRHRDLGTEQRRGRNGNGRGQSFHGERQLRADRRRCRASEPGIHLDQRRVRHRDGLRAGNQQLPEHRSRHGRYRFVRPAIAVGQQWRRAHPHLARGERLLRQSVGGVPGLPRRLHLGSDPDGKYFDCRRVGQQHAGTADHSFASAVGLPGGPDQLLQSESCRRKRE